jgi:DNA-binding transcriptional regulator PaaX
MKLEFEIALEFFFWGLETFSRRDCGLILAGYRVTQSERRLERLLDRWRQQRLVTQTGRGKAAQFTITDAGRKRVSELALGRAWDTAWDGKWRVFSFDLPTERRKDRTTLWRSLRAAKFGYLQRSVWVWPHEVESTLLGIVRARGIPECFCGFEVSRLFLCSTGEVVATAWDFEEIARRHGAYLKHAVANLTSLNRAQDLNGLARVARAERDAYRFAFSVDPLLPRALWPKSYQGPIVEERHGIFRASLRRRLRELGRS